MSKSKFQSEKDKQQSIFNCIGSITGNLSEAVISNTNPLVLNNKKSQQSPSFNQTASSPTFNQTASSPTFNQPQPGVQDVWNRLLLPKNPQPVAPVAGVQSNIETNKTSGLGSSPNINGVSKSINNQSQTKKTFNKFFKSSATNGQDMDLADQITLHNNRVAQLSRNPSSPNFVGPPAPGRTQRDTIGNDVLGNPVVNGVQMDSPFNNSAKVPFKYDFSGDAAPNLNLSSSGNKTNPAAPAVARLGYGASVRTPKAASTSKNEQTPMRGDEDQGASETNQMITPNYSGEAQHQDMFAGSGRPADTDRRPGGVENVAAGIVNKQDTIGTPNTTGTGIFTSKTGDFAAKSQNNNPPSNPGFMTSPQGAPSPELPRRSSQTGDFKVTPTNPNTPASNPGFMSSSQGSPVINSNQSVEQRADKQTGTNGRNIGDMRKENEQYAQAARDRGEPLIGSPEWVTWNRAKNQKRLDDAGINQTVDQVVSSQKKEERQIVNPDDYLKRSKQRDVAAPYGRNADGNVLTFDDYTENQTVKLVTAAKHAERRRVARDQADPEGAKIRAAKSLENLELYGNDNRGNRNTGGGGGDIANRAGNQPMTEGFSDVLGMLGKSAVVAATTPWGQATSYGLGAMGDIGYDPANVKQQGDHYSNILSGGGNLSKYFINKIPGAKNLPLIDPIGVAAGGVLNQLPKHLVRMAFDPRSEYKSNYKSNIETTDTSKENAKKEPDTTTGTSTEPSTEPSTGTPAKKLKKPAKKPVETSEGPEATETGRKPGTDSTWEANARLLDTNYKTRKAGVADAAKISLA